MVTGRAILFSASLLCADDNQKESSDPLHCSVKTSLLSSSSFWWSPPRPDQLLLLCSCWLISGTTKTCEDVILCAALQGTVSKQLMMAPLSLADRSDRSIMSLRTSQSYTLCTDLPKLRNHPNIEKNTSIVNVIDKYIHKLDIYYKKKNF